MANLFLRNVAYRIFSLIASEKVEEKGEKNLVSETKSLKQSIFDQDKAVESMKLTSPGYSILTLKLAEK